MTPSEPMIRVTRANPCPVCEKPDWCLVAADKTACICKRVESAKRCGDAGYLHRLTEPPARHQNLRVLRVSVKAPPPDLTALALKHQHAATVDRLHGFAASLSVRTESLIAFRVGWSADRMAWTFPMSDPETGTVSGIRLRRPDGGKFSVRGGREALFLPDTPPAADDPLLVLEGPTDAIAAHGIGFPNVVGRPSCTGGVWHLVALVRTRKPPAVVIVADGDEPGRKGADALATTLTLYTPSVRVIAPPAGVKDVRAWVAAGATRADVEHRIGSADVRRPSFSFKLYPTTRRTK